MQTFVPLTNFQEIVECLDMRRLNKQRIESMQILKALSGLTKGWVNHPAVKMWKDYEPALEMYMNYCIREWVNRGYKNTMKYSSIGFNLSDIELPNWWDGKIHSSHRKMLLFKNFEYYNQFGWQEKPEANSYFWPVK